MMRLTPVTLLILSGCGASPPVLSPETASLFRTLETGTALEALEAADALAQVYHDSMLARLEQVLERDARAQARGLQLIGDLETEGSARLLLERLPGFLDAESEDVRRMALSAAGLRILKPATRPILDRFERLDEKRALRALGRIWEQPLDAGSLDRSDEIDRLTVLALVHRLAMTAASSEAACAAMFRVMTAAELDEFLAKHATQRFYAAQFAVAAAGKRGFDPEKGLRIHTALLANPDPKVVESIRKTSPYRLR